MHGKDPTQVAEQHYEVHANWRIRPCGGVMLRTSFGRQVGRWSAETRFAARGTGQTPAGRRQEVIGTLEVSAAEKISGYRMKLFGAADYPDATGTPRLTFGILKGYTDRAGTPQPYASTFSGLFYRRNNRRVPIWYRRIGWI